MEQDAEQTVLNIGCGFKKMLGAINVDAYSICEPDKVWNLDEYPYPWEDGSIDKIYASHVFEHLDNWWDCWAECGRMLKLGGKLRVEVPHHTCTDTLAYPDHNHILHPAAFNQYNVFAGRKNNAWAATKDFVPLWLEEYNVYMPDGYLKWWFPKRLARWMCDHLVNYARQQVLVFVKVTEEKYSELLMDFVREKHPELVSL